MKKMILAAVVLSSGMMCASSGKAAADEPQQKGRWEQLTTSRPAAGTGAIVLKGPLYLLCRVASAGICTGAVLFGAMVAGHRIVGISQALLDEMDHDQIRSSYRGFIKGSPLLDVVAGIGFMWYASSLSTPAYDWACEYRKRAGELLTYAWSGGEYPVAKTEGAPVD